MFAGGTSTLALVGPSAGFLFGFLPGVVAIALLRGKSDTSSFAAAARTAGRYLLAALVGGVVVVYAFGFVIQSALTGAPLAAVALASMGFVGWRRHQGRGGLSGRRRPVQARSLT